MLQRFPERKRHVHNITIIMITINCIKNGPILFCFRERARSVADVAGHPRSRPIEIRLRASAADFPGTAREPHHRRRHRRRPSDHPPNRRRSSLFCNGAIPAPTASPAAAPYRDRRRNGTTNGCGGGEGGQAFRTGAQPPPPPLADPSRRPPREFR